MSEQMSDQDFIIKGGELKKYAGAGGAVQVPGGVEKIAKGAFGGKMDAKTRKYSSGAEVTSVVLPEGVEEICGQAFVKCEKLQSVELPKTVRKIGIAAFMDCASLKEIAIPSGVEEIAAYAFDRCASLEKVFVPTSVKRIGRFAFNGCGRLKELLIFPETKIGKDAIPKTCAVSVFGKEAANKSRWSCVLQRTTMEVAERHRSFAAKRLLEGHPEFALASRDRKSGEWLVASENGKEEKFATAKDMVYAGWAAD